MTNLKKRSLDFNDFKPVSDFKNEYSNSSVAVQDNELTWFSEKKNWTPFQTFFSKALWYETLPSSDEECDNMKKAINYFEDSDDSVTKIRAQIL